MPGHVEEGIELMEWLASEVSPDACVNVMPQYRPMHRAHAFPRIDRLPTEGEFEAVYRRAAALGLRLAR